MSLKFTLCKLVEIFRKCQNDMLQNHTFLKSYGRFGSLDFWEHPVHI